MSPEAHTVVEILTPLIELKIPDKMTFENTATTCSTAANIFKIKMSMRGAITLEVSSIFQVFKIKKDRFQKLVKSVKSFLEKILKQIIEQITDKYLAAWNYYTYTLIYIIYTYSLLYYMYRLLQWKIVECDQHGRQQVI